MPFQRILVLQSVEDRITNERRRRIEQSTSLKDRVFDYCYAIELTQRQKVMPVQMMVDEIRFKPLDDRSLLRRLERQITEFRPDLLVVFYASLLDGVAFALMSVLTRVKVLFPDLTLAVFSPLFPRSQVPYLRYLFTDSEEIRELLAEMFPAYREREDWEPSGR